MTRTVRSLATLAAPVALVGLALAVTPAGASPFGAVVAGPVLGKGTGIGGTVGGRLGLRTATTPNRWAGFVDVTALHFFRLSPHSDIAGVHALVAGEWSRGSRDLHAHVFAGLSLDHWRRPFTVVDQGIHTTVLAGAAGLGASWQGVRLDVETTFTLSVLSRDVDSPTIGPQVMLLFSAGHP